MSPPTLIAQRQTKGEAQRLGWSSRLRTSKASTEIVYLSAALLRLARDYWGIENRLHDVRDVGFAEDRCRKMALARSPAEARAIIAVGRARSRTPFLKRHPRGRSWSRVIADRLRVILDAAVERIGGPNLPQSR
jgi:hypothetical protein